MKTFLRRFLTVMIEVASIKGLVIPPLPSLLSPTPVTSQSAPLALAAVGPAAQPPVDVKFRFCREPSDTNLTCWFSQSTSSQSCT